MVDLPARRRCGLAAQLSASGSLVACPWAAPVRLWVLRYRPGPRNREPEKPGDDLPARDEHEPLTRSLHLNP
jgi:hypothetical protein